MIKTISYLIAVAVLYPSAQGQTPSPLPPLWLDQDIGSLQINGFAQYDQGSDTFTLTGSGSNIGDNTTDTDNFHFTYQNLGIYQTTNPDYFDGNCVITTQVTSVSGPSGWSKAGLMMRQSLDPSANSVSLVLTPKNGLNLDVRSDSKTRISAGIGLNPPGVLLTAPLWIRLVQTADDQFKAEYTKSLSQPWATLKTVTVPMAGPILAGLAVTSHDANKTASGTFVGTRITPTEDPIDFTNLPTEISLNGQSGVNGLYGDDTHAYRDPAPFYYNGIFYVFYSYTTINATATLTYWQVAYSTSIDLKTWTAPTTITPPSTALNFSSPGSIVIDGNQFVLCMQTYPTYNNSLKGFPSNHLPGSKQPIPDNIGYGSNSCYIWTTRSDDLMAWTPITYPKNVLSPSTAFDPTTAGLPSLDLYGPGVVPGQKRTIDPFLVLDKDNPSKWWCFYKDGSLIKTSFSMDDMKTWTPSGTPGITGENSCVVVDTTSVPSIYRFFYSLTGLPLGGVSRLYNMGYYNSQDLTSPWSSNPSGYFSPVAINVYPTWAWNPGSINPTAQLVDLSAGAVLDLRNEPHVAHALMFFHGGAAGSGERYFAGNNSLGLAWTTGPLETNPWTYSLKPNGR